MSSSHSIRMRLDLKTIIAGYGWLALAILYFIGAGFQAWRMSPCSDEYGHFAAGLAWWQYGDTSAFYVNPPLVRILATVPAYVAGYRLPEPIQSPRFRHEFPAGRILFAQSPPTFQFYLFLGRLIVAALNALTIALIFVVVRSATGAIPGLFASGLWGLQPQMLAHGGTIINDIPSASMILLFLYALNRSPPDKNLLEGGLGLGCLLGGALLCKYTAVLLLPLVLMHALLNLIWPRRMAVCSKISAQTNVTRSLFHRAQKSIAKLGLVLLVAILVWNLPYGFNGIGTPIQDIEFVSHLFGGKEAHLHGPANRFLDTCFGMIPLPISIDIVQGIDRQQYDFERGLISFAAGIVSEHGWYWFYPYSMLVKLPLGTLAIFGLSIGVFFTGRGRAAIASLSMIWIALVFYFIVLMNQSGFAQQHRYVFVVYPLFFVFVGIAYGIAGKKGRLIFTLFMVVTILELAGSSPYWLSSFNRLAGGFQTGPTRLANDASDWGQELYTLAEWINKKGRSKCILVSDFYLYSGAKALDIPLLSIDEAERLATSPHEKSLNVDWIAVSTTDLAFSPTVKAYFESLEMADTIGGAYRIYHIKNGTSKP